jgi:hypothetical protein
MTSSCLPRGQFAGAGATRRDLEASQRHDERQTDVVLDNSCGSRVDGVRSGGGESIDDDRARWERPCLTGVDERRKMLELRPANRCKTRARGQVSISPGWRACGASAPPQR